MDKQLFDELKSSIAEAVKIKKGMAKPSRRFSWTHVDVKSIRKKMHVSQGKFAKLIGVSIDTLQNWEQGRRKPEGPAKALLTIADKNPKALLQALHG